MDQKSRLRFVAEILGLVRERGAPPPSVAERVAFVAFLALWMVVVVVVIPRLF